MGTREHEDMIEKREISANNRIQCTHIAANRHLRIARTVAVISSESTKCEIATLLTLLRIVTARTITIITR
jgi:hypothetical protein